jgi:hypothetical protein
VLDRLAVRSFASLSVGLAAGCARRRYFCYYKKEKERRRKEGKGKERRGRCGRRKGRAVLRVLAGRGGDVGGGRTYIYPSNDVQRTALSVLCAYYGAAVLRWCVQAVRYDSTAV